MRTSANLPIFCPNCGQAGEVDLGRLREQPQAMLHCSGCGTDYFEAEAARVALLNAARPKQQGGDEPIET